MKWAMILAIALILTGCGGTQASDAEESSRSTQAQASTPAAAPSTPPTWTRAEMAAEYTAIIRRLNPMITDLNDLLDDDDATVKQVNALCEDISAGAYEVMRRASAGKWSDPVRPLVQDWIKAVSRVRNNFNACANAESQQELVDALSPMTTDNATDESSLIKIALGLPEDIH